LLRSHRQPIQTRKAERELFFWTARQIVLAVRRVVLLVVLVAVAVWFVLGLFEGHLAGGELLLRLL
jgi:hypothetical protein